MEDFVAPDCPSCREALNLKGFFLAVVESNPLCQECAKTKALHDYLVSPEYVAWLSSMPEGLELPDSPAWIEANPPPSPPIFK